MKSSFLYLLGLLCTIGSCGQNTGEIKRTIIKDTLADEPQRVYLPKPYETKSVIRPGDVIGWPDNVSPTAPPGFKVERFAVDMENPRWIYMLPNGDILVAETQKKQNVVEKITTSVTGFDKSKGESEIVNRIILFRDTDKDGNPDVKTVFLSDLNMPFGMLLLNNYFYVANTDALWRYPYRVGQTTIGSKGEKILDLPASGRHWTRNIIANNDGSKIYVAIGSASDHAENGFDKEERRANIIEINPDGSGERIYAGGLRNPVGMDWEPETSTLWVAVNERDQLGDDLPPDYITSVKDGGFYGWPYSYYGQNKDPRIKDSEQRPDLVNSAIVPDIPMGSHTATLGLVFYDKEKFPEKYHNGIFAGQHGSWNRSILSGYKVVFIPFTNGKPGAPEDFLTGFIADLNERKVYGRPVGVAVAMDGSLLVADDAGNTIWRVSYGK